MTVVDQAHSMRPRLESLLVAQMELRHHPLKNTGHLFEVGRAIEELACGCPNSHTETVERWVGQLLSGAAV
jgi:hypothetical protein